MIITKEEQQAVVGEWVAKENPSTKEIGHFIAGMNAAFGIVDKKLTKD